MTIRKGKIKKKKTSNTLKVKKRASRVVENKKELYTNPPKFKKIDGAFFLIADQSRSKKQMENKAKKQTTKKQKYLVEEFIEWRNQHDSVTWYILYKEDIRGEGKWMYEI